MLILGQRVLSFVSSMKGHEAPLISSPPHRAEGTEAREDVRAIERDISATC